MIENEGKVVGINGNMVSVAFTGHISLNEVGYVEVDNKRLKGEIIRIRGSIAQMQVFEITKGIKIGDPVYFTGDLLSVDLGPGLLGQIYDGLQNPLPQLAEQAGYFLERGVYLEGLSREKKWEFTPIAKVGDTLTRGDCFGTVPENSFTHRIMLPFDMYGTYTLKSIASEGAYTLKDTVAEVTDERGKVYPLTLSFRWPVKRPIDCYAERLKPTEPLITKIRTIDTFFPVAKGGTYCIPGPFGAGKTVLQHATSRNAEVDIVVIAACGERAGEVVETLKEFPELTDPRTGRSLMERTIIICNTSSMPVAAREASVYTGVTLAEYYRQMGLNVLLLADSTSRWAQALREMSGRLEEIPGEEAFPAYLESYIATFYERAGIVRLKDGSMGSVTIGGTVSPAGGNFEEPVTQATLKVVGAFHGLSRERSDARKYPAIHPLDSWSKYPGVLDTAQVAYGRSFLQRSSEIEQMMKVVGEEGTTIEDFVVYLKGLFLDSVYLQQNSFDEVDDAVSVERQKHCYEIILQVLGGKFNFETKDEARAYFNKLRLLFIDYNYSEWNSSKFKSHETEVLSLISEKSQELDPQAKKLLGKAG
ncbi:V-type ATP synthase subunit A [Treponema phagedenis]|uniref:V-type ATP synthase alpha chain n=1 Tax=Treponema phagedenis TaxID=162 RepID=A0AAE6M6B0_TREPH|nr:V-type ATP synthase subunit A [Treponema phagedenis]EFW38443.1 ATP synthase alpha/beta family, nucleotide-binding domain protein [Treponema phagedenis F0421]NVP25548.1 V-type ATP synthase subunit A [Treponema phagedenis]QEJ97348.1 V-type ATP synthase subunit A [Treponema phagedenis]QEK01734.1 V-type ATP synthase subunit A [Treponema phagedenis]QEK02458.1 V-type ATP synthase subunit A [Treponema phagedenis]